MHESRYKPSLCGCCCGRLLWDVQGGGVPGEYYTKLRLYSSLQSTPKTNSHRHSREDRHGRAILPARIQHKQRVCCVRNGGIYPSRFHRTLAGPRQRLTRTSKYKKKRKKKRNTLLQQPYLYTFVSKRRALTGSHHFDYCLHRQCLPRR